MSGSSPVKTKNDKEQNQRINSAYTQNVEKASGFGNNCAFNAFILGISQTKILAAIENNFIGKPVDIDNALRNFLQPAAQALKLPNPTWAEVKPALIHLRATNPKELQQKMGPILRHLSSALLHDKSTSYGANNLLRPQAALVSAFIDSMETNKDKIRVKDDIYTRIDFIADKFNEVAQLPTVHFFDTIVGNNPGAMSPDFYYAKFTEFSNKECYDLEIRRGIQQTSVLFKSLADEITALLTNTIIDKDKQNKRIAELKIELQNLEISLNEQLRVIALLEWWEKDGNDRFLNKMSDAASAQQAGHLELAPLANLFGVNLWVRTIGSVSEIHAHNGEFTGVLSPKEHSLMLSRNILRDDNNQLLKRTPEEVEKLLKAIPGYDTVMTYVRNHEVSSGASVPATWSPETIQQLKARDLVKLTADGYQFSTKLEVQSVEERINEMPRAKEILQTWKDSYQEAPTILLQNLSAVHWDHVPTVSTELPLVADEKLLDSEIVNLANKAVGDILDVLESNSAALSNNHQIANNIFLNAFTLFSKRVQDYSGKENDKGFFAKQSQEIMQEIEKVVVDNGGTFKPK